MQLWSWRATSTQSPRLEGPRVYLRPPTWKDWRAWTELRGESRDYLTPWEPTWAYDALTRRAYRRRLQAHKVELRQRTGYTFLVFRGEDDALLGGVTLSNVRRGVSQTASLGYWSGARYRRQGYMTESLAVILKFALNDLGLHRVEAACLPSNTASKSLLIRSGFREEGFAREYLRIDGRWQDHLMFGILRADLPDKK